MVSVSVDTVAHWVRDEAAGHRSWLTDVVALASESSNWNLRSIVELLREAEQRAAHLRLA